MQCICLPAFGQSLRKDVSNQNFDLPKGLERIKEEIVVLEKEYNKLVKDIDKLEDEIVSAKYTNKILEEQIDSLKRQVATLDKQLAQKKQIEKGMDSIKKQTEDNRTNKRIAEQQLIDKRAKEENLKAEMLTGDKYARLYINNLMDITKRPFSEVSPSDIEKVKFEMNEFSEFNLGREFTLKLNKFESYYKLYEDGKLGITCATTKENILNTRRQIMKILNDYDATQNNFKPITTQQYKELDNLDIALSRYKDGVNELKNIVDAINNDPTIKSCREAVNTEACLKRMTQIIEKNDGNKRAFERYFEVIPYLETLRTKYWEELKNNPLDTPTETEEEINALWKLWYETQTN